jgi:hypothetical protein
MTLQHKSILQDKTSTGGTAITSVSSSGLQTPKLSTSIGFGEENSSKTSQDDNDPILGESFEFPPPPSLPIGVKIKLTRNF